MGVGTFNLMLSTLPSKVLRLLEVVGFSGNKVSPFSLENIKIALLQKIHNTQWSKMIFKS
jgi:hypothetical protein